MCSVLLIIDEFIRTGVNEKDFQQGKTNNGAVKFPFEQLSKLVSNSIENTGGEVKSFIDETNIELNNLIDNCDGEIDCDKTILKNIVNVMKFKTKKTVEFEDKLSTLNFILTLLNEDLQSHLIISGEEERIIMLLIDNIENVIKNIREEWVKVLSQKELQKIEKFEELENQSVDLNLELKDLDINKSIKN